MTERFRDFTTRCVACMILANAIAPIVRAGSDAIELRGGWLFDGVRDAVVRNPGIRIVGGKIASVGLLAAEPDAASTRVVELSDDEYVLPGMFDLHAHYNVNLDGSGRRDETIVNPVIFLANGVTSTFPAGEYNPERMLALRKRIDRGEQVGPRLMSSGPYFGTARRGWNRNASVEEIYRDVDLWAERGARGFKAKGIAPEHLRALIERAHVHGLTVTGHLGSGFRNSVNPRDAILMGIDRVEHFLGGDALPATRPAYSSLENLDPDSPDVDKIIALFIRRDVTFDATLSAYGYYATRDEVYEHWTDEQRFFTPEIQKRVRGKRTTPLLEQFDKIYRIKHKTVKRFFDAGGRIALGTDHPSTGEYIAGFSAHRELHALVRAGIPPAAALKIATINGANAMNVGNLLGSIEPGKLADLFIIRGNPLDDIRNTRNVVRVMKAGRLYDSATLLESVEGKMAQPGRDSENRK